MPPPLALIFDLDGVLVDSEPLHRRTWLEAFERLGIALPPEEEPHLVGRRSEQVAEWLGRRHPELVRGLDPVELARLKRELYDARMEGELTAVAGADAFVRRHKGSFRLGLVSSARLEVIGRVMKLFGWRNVFEALIGAQHVANTKPHPEPYLKVAQRFKIDPGECLVFEDSVVGVEAARRAGASVCGVTTSLSPADLREAGAQWTIADFDDEAVLSRALSGSGSDGSRGASLLRRLWPTRRT